MFNISWGGVGAAAAFKNCTVKKEKLKLNIFLQRGLDSLSPDSGTQGGR